MNRWLPRTYLTLVYLLLYVPIVVLVVFSFNDSRTGYEWGGLSLRWYEALLNNRAMVQAMWNSLWLALSAATVSTLIGALTALALHRYRFRGKKVLNGMLFVVMMSPEIVLAISLLALFLLAATVGRLDLALDRVLGLHWQDLSWTSVSAALFQAFYTLGLGMGVWTILGAYTAPRTRFKRSLLATVLMDTLVAILAGLTIFALTVGGASAGDAHGFSLLFVLLPASLAPLAASQFLLAAMYLLVVLIVWATALALMEPVVAWLREWTGAPRRFSSVLVGVAVWAAGLLSLLSFNLWADVRLGGATVFRWLELVSGGVLVPVVAVLVSVFAGWCLTRRLAHRLIGETPAAFAAIWYGVLRWVLPVAVVAMGCMYSVASLESVCDAGAAALWAAAAAAA